MPLFTYTALNAQGDVVHGVVQASAEETLAEALPGLTLISQRRADASGPVQRFWAALVPPLEGADFFGQLAVLLHHKIALTEALHLMALTLPARAGTLIAIIQEHLRHGASFAEALTRVPIPHLFPSFVLSTLRSAEETGCLASSCALLQEFFTVQKDLQRQQQKAVAYPAFVLLTLLGVLTVLLRILVPNMRGLFEETDAPALGFSQRFLFALSDIAVRSPFAFALGMVVLLVVFAGAYRVFLRRNTGFGGIQALSTLAILLQAGIPLKSALDLVWESSSRKDRSALREIIHQVTSGTPLHEALASTPFFPSCAAKFAELGEASGTLGIMLAQGAQFERERVRTRARRRIALIQPILLGILGGLILWMIMTMFIPLYSRMAEL